MSNATSYPSGFVDHTPVYDNAKPKRKRKRKQKRKQSCSQSGKCSCSA